MSISLRQLAIIMFLGASFHTLRAAPGANVPWITYEAENMTNNGGTIIGPPAQVADTNAVVANTIQMEASGGQAVELTGTGQYVELTAQAAANTIAVRYCVPDTADGVGTDSTISLYQNGNFVQKLPVTSKYSWRYGSYGYGTPAFSNIPSQGNPRNFFDEVRLNGLTINPGDTVRIEKDADDLAAYDVIDLVDLEQADPITNAPANFLCITNPPYNAVGNGIYDCTTALQNCINAASSQGKTVWMPAGTYLITGIITLPSNTTVQGAGMWYVTLLGDASQYNTSYNRVTLSGKGSNIHLSDFAIVGKLNYRYDTDPNDGLGGYYGTGSAISRVWVEHTKVGGWILNSSGLVVDGCRFRDTLADGINLNTGMRSTIVTNCTARGTGDDCFAIWPASGSQTYVPGANLITHCTGQAPFLANGGAIYGAVSNRIEDCAFMDMPYGCGILIAGTFPVGANVFSGTTVVQRCDLTRCGGYDPGWQWRAAVTLCPQYINITNVNINHLNITNSLSYALEIVSPNNHTILSNATMNLVNISAYGVQVPPYQPAIPGPAINGVYGVWARSDAYGSLNVCGLTVNGGAITSMPASGPDMSNQSSGSPVQHFAFNFIPAPSLTSVASGNLLQLSWPTSYIGWTLQAQTNMPGGGISPNWSVVSGSSTTNQLSTTLDNTTGSIYFRLINL